MSSTTTRGCIDDLAEWAAGLRTAGLPADTAQASARSAIDSLGCAVQGLRNDPIRAVTRAFDRAISNPPTTSGLISLRVGTGETDDHAEPLVTTPEDAAFAIAASGHGQDFDDSHMTSITHPTSPALGASLATGALIGATPQEVSTAVAIGQEVAIRVGLASQGAFAPSGINTTAVTGSIGAAAAAGFLLGHDARGIATAMSLAAGTAAGTQEWSTTGADNKWAQVGIAASAGVKFALIAAHVPTYAPFAIEGRHGLFATHLDIDMDQAVTLLTDDLGTRWHLEQLALKPYASCHGTHAVLDAVNQLSGELTGITPAEVDDVVCLVGVSSERLTCIPWETKLAPTTEYALRFSLPGVTALALEHVSAHSSPFRGWSADPRELNADAGRDWLDKVRYTLHDENPVISGRILGAVEITLADGRRIATTVETNRGAPDYPMTPQERSDKFMWNVGCPSAETGCADHTHDRLVQAVANDDVVALLADGIVTPGHLDFSGLRADRDG